MLKKFKSVYFFLRRVLLSIPKAIRLLIKNQDLLEQPSYYPEKNFHKTKAAVFIDQFRNILKYGEEEHYYFMYGFDTKTKKEIDQYMNLRQFMKLRDDTNLLSNRFNASCILRNKLYFGFFVKSLGIKTGNNVALITNNSLFDLTNTKWCSICNFLKSYSGTVFCKKLDGECGKDIFVAEISNDIITINGKKVDITYFESLVKDATYLLQEKVLQHHEMNRLYPNSLNTIRLVTIKNIKTGEIKLFPSNLRIGAHGSYVDNGSQGGIAVGFDLESGKLFKYGLQKPPYGTKTTTHPDTGIEFASFSIPFIKEAETHALFLHSMLDGIYSIGWDIAITENGPLFIEGNDNWELQAIQRTHGGLKIELLSALGL